MVVPGGGDGVRWTGGGTAPVACRSERRNQVIPEGLARKRCVNRTGCDGVPVLGVVHAPVAPDDRGDLIAWADGLQLTRNDRVVVRPALAEVLHPYDIVLVSQDADQNPKANAGCVTPARFRSVPSIAYRLALLAVGEGEAAVSLNGPVAWDFAGGHALIRAVGGDLVDRSWPTHQLWGCRERRFGTGVRRVTRGGSRIVRSEVEQRVCEGSARSAQWAVRLRSTVWRAGASPGSPKPRAGMPPRPGGWRRARRASRVRLCRLDSHEVPERTEGPAGRWPLEHHRGSADRRLGARSDARPHAHTGRWVRDRRCA